MELLRWQKNLEVDYVFVAPDDPLVMGMVDALQAEGFHTFGPKKNAAILEGSKVIFQGFDAEVPYSDCGVSCIPHTG